MGKVIDILHHRSPDDMKRFAIRLAIINDEIYDLLDSSEDMGKDDRNAWFHTIGVNLSRINYVEQRLGIKIVSD